MKIAPFFTHLLLLLAVLATGCSPTKNLDRSIILDKDDIADTVTIRQSYIPVQEIDNIVRPVKIGPSIQDNLRINTPEGFLIPEYPVARQVVENYMKSDNKEPGGHCLTASKTRFLRAYEDVYGHPIYQDLPDSIATKYYNPAQVFHHLYASTSGRHKGWRTLPRKYRGRGNAGAIAQAGMGELVDGKGIWNGELRPGAPMQVWRHRTDYRAVVRGVTDPKIDPFGHSFIFLSYVKDTEGKIIGIKIADQGYQSQRTLVPRDYEVWWGVNLEI